MLTCEETIYGVVMTCILFVLCIFFFMYDPRGSQIEFDPIMGYVTFDKFGNKVPYDDYN